MGSSMLTACSRQIFAFSRDGGLPLSSYLYNISSRTHAPIQCVWFAVFLSFLLGLLAFAGASAIGAVFSLVVAGQYIAYSIPISARFLGGQEVRKGPFRLGVFSLPIAAIAVTFMLFMVVVFMFPADVDPTSSNMNYTVVVLGGTLFLSIVYFYFPKYGGVPWFTGPVRTLNVDLEDEKSSTGEHEPEQEDEKA